MDSQAHIRQAVDALRKAERLLTFHRNFALAQEAVNTAWENIEDAIQKSAKEGQK